MMLKGIIFGALALLALSAPASAQCTGTFAANTFCGSLTGGPPGPRAISAGVINMAAGTVLGNPGTVAAAGADLRAVVLGLNGTDQGSIGLRGSTSGTVTIQPGAAAAGTFNFNLPTAAGASGLPLLSGGGGAAAQTYGILGLAGGGTNAALTASNGGLVYSTGSALAILSGTATAGQIPRSGASAAPSWSASTYPDTAAQGSILAAGAANVISATRTPTLGLAGTAIGTLGFAGNTSGTVTVTPQATAGSPTLTLPNTTGTFAVGASLPIVLSATTGGLTCPTCVTSSGGGAITGVAPVAVSGAGAVSITGAAGQVLAGAGPAFTATPTLGVQGATVGTLAFENATSGSITLTPTTGALGTRTITLPAASGTVAVSATAPITLSAAGAIGVTGAALTRVDDTNVTLTLGGTPTTALLQATSITVGWTGQLAMTRGGSGASLTASNGGIVWTDANSMEVLAATATAAQMLRSGSNATPSWSTAVWPNTAAAGTFLVAATSNTVTATATPTLGVAGSLLGTLSFAGNTSGTVTMRPAAAAGTWTFQLPADDGNSGEFLRTDGAGITTWAAVAGSGTVTTITQGGLTTLSTNPCTVTCTIGTNATITPQGRLTLTTGTPVLIANVGTATTLFYTPYAGNLVPIYDGTNFNPTPFAEVSQATTDATKSPAAASTNLNYDIFCWIDTGPTNRCTRGPPWTSGAGAGSATARGTGAGSSALTRVNGILLNEQSITNGPAASRGTYVGTIRTDASSQLNFIVSGGSAAGVGATLSVWNMYNRVPVMASVTDVTAGYTYTTGTIRQARASTTNQINYTLGLAEEPVQVSYNTTGQTVATMGAELRSGVGCGSTSAFSFAYAWFTTSAASSIRGSPNVTGLCPATLGLNLISANEQGDGAAANTFNTQSTNVLFSTLRM